MNMEDPPRVNPTRGAPTHSNPLVNGQRAMLHLCFGNEKTKTVCWPLGHPPNGTSIRKDLETDSSFSRHRVRTRQMPSLRQTSLRERGTIASIFITVQVSYVR